jgi:hypothetical protein
MAWSEVISPDADALAQRGRIWMAVVEAIRGGARITLPEFDPETAKPSEVAMLTLPANAYRGAVGGFVYQLEGEDDLLHLAVSREDGLELAPEQGQAVAGFVFEGVPASLVWLKPGRLSQHFYVGHEELLAALTSRVDTPAR